MLVVFTMKPETINKLKCINCDMRSFDLKVLNRDKNEITEGYLVCKNCGMRYRIKEGILVMMPKNAKIEEDDKIRVFHEHADRYDSWFVSDKGKILFQNELKAVKKVIRGIAIGDSVELGVGTGEFAVNLNIGLGIDPAWNALKYAKRRGIEVIQGIAEQTPFRENIFDTVFIIVSICYVKSPTDTVKEAYRILRNNGYLIIGFIDRESPWGEFYLHKKRSGHVFYKPANFYTFDEIQELLRRNGFKIIKVVSIIRQKPTDSPKIEEPILGRDKASFIVILALKK